jgi:hypothetical protein
MFPGWATPVSGAGFRYRRWLLARTRPWTTRQAFSSTDRRTELLASGAGVDYSLRRGTGGLVSRGSRVVTPQPLRDRRATRRASRPRPRRRPIRPGAWVGSSVGTGGRRNGGARRVLPPTSFHDRDYSRDVPREHRNRCPPPRRIRPRTPGTWADVGCGTGTFHRSPWRDCVWIRRPRVFRRSTRIGRALAGLRRAATGPPTSVEFAGPWGNFTAPRCVCRDSKECWTESCLPLPALRRGPGARAGVLDGPTSTGRESGLRGVRSAIREPLGSLSDLAGAFGRAHRSRAPRSAGDHRHPPVRVHGNPLRGVRDETTRGAESARER